MQKKKIIAVLMVTAMAGAVLAGCGKESKEEILVDPDIQVTQEEITEEATKADTELDSEFSVDEEMMVEPETVVIPGYTSFEEVEKSENYTTEIFKDEDGKTVALYSGDLSDQVFASDGQYWQIGYIGDAEYRMTTNEDKLVYSLEWEDEDGTQHRISAPDGMDFGQAMSTLYENLEETKADTEPNISLTETAE